MVTSELPGRCSTIEDKQRKEFSHIKKYRIPTGWSETFGKTIDRAHGTLANLLTKHERASADHNNIRGYQAHKNYQV